MENIRRNTMKEHWVNSNTKIRAFKSKRNKNTTTIALDFGSLNDNKTNKGKIRQNF